MILHDALYGKFETVPVIEALIESAPIQRLKGIHQGGAIFLVDPSIAHTRYEHSIGVLYLVQQMGGGIEEQIAALLHDVSHTAFSHVADYVFNRRGEDYHEHIFEDVVQSSVIPAILLEYGYRTEDLFHKQYPLLEQPYPYLCADRIDYTLRDSHAAGLMELNEIRWFINELTITDGRITCKDQVPMDWFRERFKALNKEYFRKPGHLFANHRLAELLEHALYWNIIREQDLMGSDDEVLDTLRGHNLTNGALSAIKRFSGFGSFNAEEASARLKIRAL
ncbi:HD domain-containing protein [Olivibacter sp. XZL3]|uniref:HD domain-containing protein n=1 Tax=Olivibacter sp. XZL3 TaxID=1735116 RepID=UPI00106497E9|nr:HD domain-containing protein [Olivibacter sp. XZL3]